MDPHWYWAIGGLLIGIFLIKLAGQLLKLLLVLILLGGLYLGWRFYGERKWEEFSVRSEVRKIENLWKKEKERVSP